MAFQILDSTGKIKTSVAVMDAADITSGTLVDARMPNLTGDVTTVEGAVATTLANIPAISGINLTNLNATNLASGTVADARLSANVALLNAANSFTLINPLTTIAESWVGPSSTTGVYFKDGLVGIGTATPGAILWGGVRAILNLQSVAASSHTIIGVNSGATNKVSGFGFGSAGTPKWIMNCRNSVDAPNDRFVLYNAATVEVFTLLQGGNLLLQAPLRIKNYTVGTLPVGARGDIAYVTDALAPTFLANIVGGGAVVTPVFYNGANWVGF